MYLAIPLDLIAIPDFSAGAMENWGLITYRLTSLLSNPKESSTGNKQWVETVVAHELAHQVMYKQNRLTLDSDSGKQREIYCHWKQQIIVSHKAKFG